MKSHSKNNSGKKEIELFGKRSFLVYALLALVVVTAAAVVLIAPGGSENSSAAGTWIGDGSPTDPYQIGSVQDLADLANDVNYNGNDHSGEWFILTADIDLSGTSYSSGVGWTPIGSHTNNFSGNFDGNGHTVSNLFINTTGSYIGLFGQSTNGIIENLGVVNADVTGASDVGGLVGYATNCTIENCYATGTVTGNGYYVGGVVGIKINGSIVENCYNTSDVTGAGYYVGGVNGSGNGTIVNCYNIGAVKGSGTYVGGVVGGNAGTVENCYNTGTVTGSGNNVGGITGLNDTGGTVENCYNTGAVSLTGSGSTVGGVVGVNNSTVENCYNAGVVTLTGGGSYVGGVVGLNSNGTVENCYNAGDVTGSGNSVGGVVGYNPNGTTENCYNTGDVTSSGSSVGGVVGNNSNNGTVENCFFKWESGGFNGTLRGIGSSASDTGAARTSDADLQTLVTFTGAGWDFTGIGGAPPVWFMLNTVTYPMLFWQIADSGSGFDSDPYVVTTVQQIENIQTVFVLHGASGGVYWQLGKNIDATGYFAEGAPGYNSDAGWVPIGNSSAQPFQGNFDGNGHTITGLFINDTSLYYVGLFGIVNHSEIMNLGIVNANITGNTYVGGVIGNNAGIVENCYVTGTVSGSSSVGGVVGFNNSGIVENCYSTCTINGGSTVGGVVGFCNTSTLMNCYSAGSVSGSSVGGVATNASGNAPTNCYYNTDNYTGPNNGIGTGLTTAQMTAGNVLTRSMSGLGPAFEKRATDKYLYYPELSVFKDNADPAVQETSRISVNAGEAPRGSGTATDPFLLYNADDLAKLSADVNGGNTFTGVYFRMAQDIDLGVAPYNAGWTPIGNGNAYFDGTFNGDSYVIQNLTITGTNNYVGLFGQLGSNGIVNGLGIDENSSVSGYSYVGGVVGESYGTITNCYNTGTVGGISNVGGVAGASFMGTVTNCYNTGTVGGNVGGNNVGGVVGYNNNVSTVTNCYNTGSVISSFYVGGLVGYNNNSSMVTNCYNTGSVGGTNGVGGVVGQNTNSGITNCYNTNSVSGSTSVGGVVGFNGSMVVSSYSIGPVGDVGIVDAAAAIGIMNCYYNIDTSPFNGYGTGLTTDQMTANDVLSDSMNGLGHAFEKRANDNYLYYPELSVFKNNADPNVQEMSKVSAIAGDNWIVCI